MKTENNIQQIRDAITTSWPNLPDEFRGWQLWGKVNKLLPHLNVYNDTILHTLREMNRRGVVRYDCINRTESLYRKVIDNHSK